jgi:hypothetical protein
MTTADELTRLIGLLDNGDIRWDGTLVGLQPAIVGNPARLLLAAGRGAAPVLVDALADPARFVAAHVLLTWLAGGAVGPGPTWNGLDIDLRPDGSVHADPEQRSALASQWRAWLRGAH